MYKKVKYNGLYRVCIYKLCVFSHELLWHVLWLFLVYGIIRWLTMVLWIIRWLMVVLRIFRWWWWGSWNCWVINVHVWKLSYLSYLLTKVFINFDHVCIPYYNYNTWVCVDNRVLLLVKKLVVINVTK
jgi:hypothetical protein